MKKSKLDELKRYSVYLTDEEKDALADIKLDCSTFEESVLAGLVYQIFNVYEDESNDNT